MEEKKKRLRKSKRAEEKKLQIKVKIGFGVQEIVLCFIKCQFSKETNESSHTVIVMMKARVEIYTSHFLSLHSPHHLAPSNSDSRLGDAL